MPSAREPSGSTSAASRAPLERPWRPGARRLLGLIILVTAGSDAASSRALGEAPAPAACLGRVPGPPSPSAWPRRTSLRWGSPRSQAAGGWRAGGCPRSMPAEPSRRSARPPKEGSRVADSPRNSATPRPRAPRAPVRAWWYWGWLRNCFTPAPDLQLAPHAVRRAHDLGRSMHAGRERDLGVAACAAPACPAVAPFRPRCVRRNAAQPRGRRRSGAASARWGSPRRVRCD